MDASNRSMMYELNHSNLPMANCITESLELTDTSRNGEDFTKIHWNAGFKPLWYLAPFAFVNRYLMTRTWTRSLGRAPSIAFAIRCDIFAGIWRYRQAQLLLPHARRRWS